MENSVKLKNNKYLYTNNINKFFIFFTGFFSVYFTNIKLSLYFRAAFLVLIMLYLIYDIVSSGKISFKGILWYIVFFIYTIFSLLYSSNTDTYMVVIERMIPTIAIGLVVFQSKNQGYDVSYFFFGVIVGMAISAGIVIFSSKEMIGNGRIGAEFYGSDVEFGSLCCYALYSSFILFFCYKKKSLVLILLTIFLYFGVLVSGTRKSTIQPFIVLGILFLFKYRKSTKLIFIIVLSIASFICIYYMLLHNDFFYNLVGKRIESMINSFIETDIDESMLERKKMATLAFSNFVDRPLFGHGIYSFAYDFSSVFGREVYSHNNYAEILYCYGIVGIVLYYWKALYSILNYKAVFYSINNMLFGSIFIVIVISDVYSISYLQPLPILYISIFMNNIILNKRNI